MVFPCYGAIEIVDFIIIVIIREELGGGEGKVRVSRKRTIVRRMRKKLCIASKFSDHFLHPP